MDNKRETFIKFRVNEDEKIILQKKFELSDSTSLSEFIRKTIFYGLVVKFDDEKLQAIQKDISGIAININQIARRVNSTSNIYREDISQMEKGINEIWQQQKYFQSELLKLKP